MEAFNFYSVIENLENFTSTTDREVSKIADMAKNNGDLEATLETPATAPANGSSSASPIGSPKPTSNTLAPALTPTEEEIVMQLQT